MDKIYKVTTEGDCEGRTTKILGYAKGDITDIKAYFQDKKAYSLDIREINVLNITPESADNKIKLINQKESLERQLKSINEILK